jgi:hypothetical protein
MINPEEKPTVVPEKEEQKENVDKNNHDEHMQVDEEGNEVLPDDQV